MCTFLLAMTAITVAAAPPQFDVQTLDGQTVTGSLVKLTGEQLTLRTAGGPVSLHVDKLMMLSPAEQPTLPAEQPAVRIELVDGSSLVAREYTVSDGRARITLADGHAVETSTAGVASVRLRPPTDQFAAEWSQILGEQVQSDLLVVRKGDTIDYHKGLLRDVTDEVVRFELDGDVLPVKRSKVYGLLYYRPPGASLPPPVCQLTDTSGSQWSVRSFSLADEVQGPGMQGPGMRGIGLQWTTPAGLTVTRPLATVAKIDFSGGKVVFLSDLKPESVSFTPYFGTNEEMPMLAKFFGPRNDKSLESGPLRLGKQEYRKGLALHSRTRVVYRLPDRFRRLKAIVGIDDAVRPHGHVRLVISGDEKVLLETTVTGADPPKPVDLDLTGVRRLAILVDFGEKLDVADHLDLCEARVIK